MSFSARSFVAFLCMAFHGVYFSYKPAGAVHKKYKSLADKTCLFQKLGCTYSNKVNVKNPHYFQYNPKKAEYYNAFKSSIDMDAKKYASLIKKHENAPMYLQWISDVVGYGVYADIDIKKGDFIGEYTGILRPVKSSGDNVDYAWYYTLDAPDGSKLVVDGKTEGNELRFINHANDPNLLLSSVLGDDGAFHLIYVAQKDIPKNKQLTVSYGSGYWDSRDIKPEDF